MLTPVDNDDFFTSLKNFIAANSDLGWVIDAQDSEYVYFHNADGDYYGFRYAAATMGYGNVGNPFYNNPGMVLFVMGADSYNSAQDFYNQENSSTNALTDMKDSRVKYMGQCVFIFNKTWISNVFICIDDKSIVMSFEFIDGRLRYIILTKLTKTINFNGSNIISSSQLLRTNNSSTPLNITNSFTETSWNTNNYMYIQYPQTSPFSCGMYEMSDNNSCYQAFKLNNLWSFCGYIRRGITDTYDNNYFATNLIIGYAVNIPIAIKDFIPFDPKRMVDIGSSKYTGLNALITPHYFIKSNENKFILAGYLDKIKLVSNKNLNHGQEIWYGDKKYLILGYAKENQAADKFLAVDITDA
jgi:hypothetical protein